MCYYKDEETGKEIRAMDRIIISGLKLFAYHGVNPEEKEEGQNFVFDIVCTADTEKAGQTDCIDDTVSYAKIIKTVRRVFTAEKYNLLEKAAQVTADAILDEYPAVSAVEITLKKPEAPIKADFGYVAVSIRRERKA